MTFVKVGEASLNPVNVDGVVYENCTVCGAHVYIKVLMRGGGKVLVEEVYYQDALDGPWNPNKARFYARAQQRVGEISELLQQPTIHECRYEFAGYCQCGRKETHPNG